MSTSSAHAPSGLIQNGGGTYSAYALLIPLRRQSEKQRPGIIDVPVHPPTPRMHVNAVTPCPVSGDWAWKRSQFSKLGIESPPARVANARGEQHASHGGKRRDRREEVRERLQPRSNTAPYNRGKLKHFKLEAWTRAGHRHRPALAETKGTNSRSLLSQALRHRQPMGRHGPGSGLTLGRSGGVPRLAQCVPGRARFGHREAEAHEVHLEEPSRYTTRPIVPAGCSVGVNK